MYCMYICIQGEYVHSMECIIHSVYSPQSYFSSGLVSVPWRAHGTDAWAVLAAVGSEREPAESANHTPPSGAAIAASTGPTAPQPQLVSKQKKGQGQGGIICIAFANRGKCLEED